MIKLEDTVPEWNRQFKGDIEVQQMLQAVSNSVKNSKEQLKTYIS